MTGPHPTGPIPPDGTPRRVIRRAGADGPAPRPHPDAGAGPVPFGPAAPRPAMADRAADVVAVAGLDRDRLRELAPLAAWLVALVGAVVALHALGRSPLASPPVTDPAGWWAWAQGRTADELAFNLLRIVGLALAWYLLGATTVGAVARLARLGGLVAVADRLSVGPVRRLLQATLGATLAVGVVAQVPGTALDRPAPMADEAASGGDVAVGVTPLRAPAVPGAIGDLVLGDPVPQGLVRAEAELRGPVVGTDGWAHLLTAGVRSPDDTEAASQPRANSLVASGTVGGQLTTTGSGAAEAAGTDPATHVVVAGDHFWSLAEDVLGATSGSDIGEQDVHAYWLQLVEANRDRLVDPANPDLLLPGQVLVLPAPTAEAG